MAWYDDLWSGIKSAVSEVAGVVKDVAPIIPLLLKKGGKVSEFKDTPANRRKLVNAIKKMHPAHSKKIDMAIKKLMPKKKRVAKK